MPQTIVRGVVDRASRLQTMYPEEWRRQIFRITPPKKTPLTILMDAMGDEETMSVKYNWSTQPFSPMCGTIVDVYTTDPILGSPAAYASGGVKGTQLYIQVTAANAKGVLIGDTVLLSSDATFAKIPANVLNVTVAGDTTSSLLVELMKADTGNALALTSTLRYTISGRAEEEEFELGEVVYEEPEWYDNYAQQLSAAYSVTRRAAKEKERVAPALKVRMKQQALEKLMRKREMMRLVGYKDSKAKGKTFSMGLLEFLETNAAANVLNYKTDPRFAGKSALSGTLQFLRVSSEIASRFSDADHKTCFTSGVVLDLIDECIGDQTYYKIGPEVTAFGIRMKTLRNLRQEWRLVEHPLMTNNPALCSSMIVTELPLLKTRTMFPLEFIPEGGARVDGWNWQSSVKAGWVVDEGMQFDNPSAHLWIDGLGEANTYGT